MTNCTKDGCDQPLRARGWCQKHYAQWRRWRIRDDPSTAPQREIPDCSVDECKRPAAVRGWCRTHYSRWVSTGDPAGLRRAPNGSGWISHGYRVMQMPEHPLASRLGRVFQHRQVLYDTIGPGEHPCHWCGRIVSWDHKENAGESTLITDHLDENTLNNGPDNLVPSCWKCNVNRNQTPRWWPRRN